jgi:hypothetical protein
MADLDLLTEIHTDVKYIKKTLDNHIIHDEAIVSKYVAPLWESHQQNIGEKKSKKISAVILDKTVNATIAIVAAWAAVRGLR